MNNIVLNWLRENIQRLFIKTPAFFKVWAFISGALVLITGIPEFINALPFDITISDLWNEKITWCVAWASRGMLAMALLTTQSNPVAVTTKGVVIKETNEKMLPFTVAIEQKAAIEKDVPVVKMKVVDEKTEEVFEKKIEEEKGSNGQNLKP